MRAARYYTAGDIRVEDIDEPNVSDGKIVVDVDWCGICGSDLHEYIMGPVLLPTEPHPTTGEKLPLTLGHELCGRVKNPPSGSRFKDGEAVMVDPRKLCGSCDSCKAGRTHCCHDFGYIGGVSGGSGGGYGERVTVEENMLKPLGPNIPPKFAACIEPLSVVHHAVKQSGITDWKEKSVLVLGGGPIGFALLLDLKAHGATNVIVSEPTVRRREQMKEFSQAVINPLEENVGDKCRELTNGKGVDVVFDCAGVPAALAAGFDAIRSEGSYIMIAVWEKPLTIDSWTLLKKHITLKGVLIFNGEDFDEVMQWMAEGKLTGYEKMVTSWIHLDDVVEKGFKELINNKDDHIKIMVTPKKSLLAH